MMPQEDWMNLQELRTAKKYLTERPRPPRYGPRRRSSKLIDPFTGVIDAWLRASRGTLQATSIFERLSREPYRFPGSYQRVKEYVALRRQEIVAELGIRDPAHQMHAASRWLRAPRPRWTGGRRSRSQRPQGR